MLFCWCVSIFLLVIIFGMVVCMLTFRDDHLSTASAIRLIRSTFGLFSPFEPFISCISSEQKNLINMDVHLDVFYICSFMYQILVCTFYSCSEF